MDFANVPGLPQGQPHLAGGGCGGGSLLRVSALLALAFLLPLLTDLTAQGITTRLTARAILAYDHVDPVPGGRSLGEIRVVQPVLMLRSGAWADRLVLHGTLNLEGWTIPQGELTPGAWGEGFTDRRHPHTYVHEFMLSANDLLGNLDGSTRVSLSAGKGFAPFGSDDPMNRPGLRFPVNHHLSQILERAVAIAGVRSGPIVAEGGLFNGDEPERPGQWPRIGGRFGDSWSLRLTVHPALGVEFQGSRAKVHSPEHRPGAGTDNLKWSASARLARAWGRSRVYALAEWARTTEASGFFRFHSVLVEGAWTRGRQRPYYRFERTERPEDSRTLDPFRSLRPHLDNSIVGITRWTIHTAGYGLELAPSSSALEVAPFLEGSYAQARNPTGGVFDPVSFYGRDHIWALSLGVRLGWRSAEHRMGRYGVLDEPAHDGSGHHH